MVEPITQQRVSVQRAQDDEPFEAVTQCAIYQEYSRDGGQTVTKGELLGYGVRDDRGFEMIAQPAQISQI